MKKKSLKEKYGGMDFASISKAIDKKFKNKDTDLIEKKSFEMEMAELEDLQTQARTIDKMTTALKEFKKGGTLPKYNKGTEDPLSVPPGVDPWSFADVTPTVPVPPVDYGTRPDTINSFVKSQLNTGMQPPVYDNEIKPRTGPMTIDNNFGMSKPSDAPKLGGEGSAYTPALIGQGISTLLNAGLLVGGYDKAAPVDNPNEASVTNLMANRNIDTTQQTNAILSAYNAARSNLSNARSANVRNALDANLMNTTQDSLAESNLNQQQINNQYASDLASTLNNLGQQKVSAQNLSNELTARNKGQFQSNLSAFGASVADNSKFFTTSKLNEIQNKMLGDILNNKYSDVGLNKDVVARLSEGKPTPDDIIVLKNAYGEEAANVIIKKFGE